ncbi:uncharacterized protein LOC112344541 isoform X1 [Selaginella moellendorffii]|uniref:uncharacterized protein LOC112344541 isoform X1 n=1 Tax=Selaginella moellendorffii TaxID=88036 RepID=UPI000D1C4D20|nr:uncharacterized protein LOC112344541 isoform X1 [Selaginella moellendorffii]|eukprot:XP_024525168.1 uncharacterized protein LOC112344541 isoform X1 [Selaginella moellendorffii]
MARRIANPRYYQGVVVVAAAPSFWELLVLCVVVLGMLSFLVLSLLVFKFWKRNTHQPKGRRVFAQRRQSTLTAFAQPSRECSFCCIDINLLKLKTMSGIRNIDFGRTPAVRPSSNNPIFYAPRISDYEYLLDYQHSRMMPGVVLDFQSSRMVPAVHSGSLDTDLAELPRSVVPQPPSTSEIRLPLTTLDFVIPPAFMPGQLQQEQSHHDITTASSLSSESQLLPEIDNEFLKRLEVVSELLTASSIQESRMAMACVGYGQLQCLLMILLQQQSHDDGVLNRSNEFSRTLVKHTREAKCTFLDLNQDISVSQLYGQDFMPLQRQSVMIKGSRSNAIFTLQVISEPGLIPGCGSKSYNSSVRILSIFLGSVVPSPAYSFPLNVALPELASGARSVLRITGGMEAPLPGRLGARLLLNNLCCSRFSGDLSSWTCVELQVPSYPSLFELAVLKLNAVIPQPPITPLLIKLVCVNFQGDYNTTNFPAICEREVHRDIVPERGKQEAPWFLGARLLLNDDESPPCSLRFCGTLSSGTCVELQAPIYPSLIERASLYEPYRVCSFGVIDISKITLKTMSGLTFPWHSSFRALESTLPDDHDAYTDEVFDMFINLIHASKGGWKYFNLHGLYAGFKDAWLLRGGQFRAEVQELRRRGAPPFSATSEQQNYEWESHNILEKQEAASLNDQSDNSAILMSRPPSIHQLESSGNFLEVISIAADCSSEDLERQVRGSRHFSDAAFNDAGGEKYLDLMRHEPAGDLEDGWEKYPEIEELPIDEGWIDFSELVSDKQGDSAVFVEIREADQPGSSENEDDLTPYAAAELLDALTFMGDIATPLFCATGIEKAIIMTSGGEQKVC